MMKKKLLVIWFGKYPVWLDRWVSNMESLKKYGYDYQIFSNLEFFKQRVRNKLGIEPNIEPGTGKPWDYRPTLGVLFEDELKGYDMWGHTDFDCVYGNPDHFIPDSFLRTVDIFSNHIDYIAGPFSLYKNCEKVNHLFEKCPTWKERVLDSSANGWLEMDFTKTANQHVNIKYASFQTNNWDDFSTLSMRDGCLYEDGKEVFMAHFRRVKEYPDV